MLTSPSANMKMKVEDVHRALGTSKPTIICDIKGHDIHVARLQEDIEYAIQQDGIDDNSDDEHGVPDTGSSLAGDFGPREAPSKTKHTTMGSSLAGDFGPHEAFSKTKHATRMSSQAADFGFHQVAPLKLPMTARAVEGVSESDPFVAAEKRNLHGAPLMPSGCNSHKYEAYVVFVGWEPGVYQTWAAARSQIFRCPGGFSKGYVTIDNARRAYAHSISNGSGGIAISRPTEKTIHASTLTATRTAQSPVSCGGTPTPIVKNVELPKSPSYSRPLSNHKTGLTPPPAPKTHSADLDYRQSYRRIPSCSDVLPSDKYETGDKIIVVFHGKEPGIYFTKQAAMAGIGDVNDPDVYFDYAADRSEAFEMYGVADMEGQLVWLK